jgi:PAT family beta-lactamase induction signal transducer AmpG
MAIRDAFAMNNWLRSLAVYADRRIIAILFLGFSSGLPLSLVYATLSARLAEAGVSMTMIGLFSWASTAYGFKWLWSPLVDRLPIPLLTPLLGQRRGWMVLSQVATAICMVGLGSTDPSHSLVATAGWAVALAFTSATQDIVIDAYRVEILKERELGAGAGNIVLGYRLGMIVSGGGALVIADLFGWFAAYAAMAALMGIGLGTALISKEPARPEVEETSLTRDPIGWIRTAIAAPLTDFTQRPHWLLILLFIALYKYGDALLGVMANPFYLDIGFTKAEIGLVSKSYGVIMTIVGGLAGGVIVARLGIMRALLICGVLQAASNLVFVAQAMAGADLSVFVVTMSVENLAGGMGTAAFVAYLSSLCNVAYTATQYALVSSFMAFTRTIFASGGGWLADRVDWVTYFLISTAAALPGLLLLLWMMRAFPQGGAVRLATEKA